MTYLLSASQLAVLHQHLCELVLHCVVAFPEVQCSLRGLRLGELQAWKTLGGLFFNSLDHACKNSGRRICLGLGVLNVRQTTAGGGRERTGALLELILHNLWHVLHGFLVTRKNLQKISPVSKYTLNKFTSTLLTSSTGDPCSNSGAVGCPSQLFSLLIILSTSAASSLT